MKRIDLLNKLANGEEVPRIIHSHRGNNVYYDKSYQNYRWPNGDIYTFSFKADELNDEIYIVEEPIEKKRTVEVSEDVYLILIDAYNKLNEINELKRKGIE